MPAANPGYSGKPLGIKFGLKPGQRALLVGEPAGFRRLLKPLPPGLTFVSRRARSLDVIVVFETSAARYRAQLKALLPRLKPDGMLWACWPKKTSGVAADLAEDMVRRIGLEAGVVDVKVCAVDQVWSGLKFVRRLKDR